MSLIIDALKKAQELRLKRPEGPPILKYPRPDKKRGRSSKKRWGLICFSLISLCALSFIFLRPASPPFATQSDRATIVMETKPPGLVAEKASQDISTKNDEPPPAPNPDATGLAGEERLPYVGGAVNSSRPRPKVGKGSSEARPSIGPPINKMREESLIKQVPSPFPPVARKDETSSQPIGVEQEGGKGRVPTSEVLYHFNSGVTFYNQKEFSRAIQAYKKVLELDPAYVEAYNNLGIIYQMIGDVDRASEAYRKSTEINPRYERGYNNLGILFLLQGRYDEALDAFQKALAINPNAVESHINLGILSKKRGEWDKAIASYQSALAIDPLHKETHYNIALLYEHLGNSELAVIHYQQFIQLSKKSHPELVSRVQRHLNALVETEKSKN